MSIVDDVQFPSPSDEPVTLVGKYHHFEEGNPRPTVMVCHPSSRGEAHFNHPIVRKLTPILHDAGFNVLRFNLRGIPPSTGTISVGKYEPDDVRGALDFLMAQPDVDHSRVYVVGHSFGGAMALYVASGDNRVKGAISLGFPLRAFDPTIPGATQIYQVDRPAALDAIRKWTRPKVFITGDADRSGPPAKVLEYFLTVADPKSFLIIGGSDHYFGQGERRNLEHPGLNQAAQYVLRTLLDWAHPER